MKSFKVKNYGLAANLFFCSFLIVGFNANAQDQFVLSGTDTRYSQPSQSSGRLIEIGQAKGNFEPLKGFARDLPLLTVLRQITPNGWVVKKNDTPNNTLNVQQLISWNGGQSWVATLSEASQRYNFNTTVNWNTQEIILSPVTPVALKRDEIRTATRGGTNVFELSPAASTFTLDKANESVVTMGASSLPVPPSVRVETIEPVVVANAAPVIAVETSWVLSSEKTLKENVEDWGRKAGYRIVWNAEDYPVDQNRTIVGSFESEEGPIRQLSLDYGPESRVQQPLAFQFYQNKTLVVDDFRFEQQGFPQYVQQ